MMHNKSKIKTDNLLYVFIFVVTLISFWFQTNTSSQINLFFLIVYFAIFFSVSELFDFKSGLFASATVVALQLMKGLFFANENSSVYLLIAILQTVLTAYYFLVKKLLKTKIQKTLAREKYFRNLVNVSLQPMLIKNKEGEIQFASESIEKILETKKSLIIGKNMSEMIHPEDINIYTQFFDQVLSQPDEKKSIEFRIKKNSTEWIWARNEAINLLNHPDIKAIISSLQDVTTQKTIDQQKTDLFEAEKSARAIAEKAIRDRDEFLSIASHELKTPLTTVLLQLQATLRKISTQSLADFSGGELLNSLQIAERQSQSLSTLIKDLLNVSIASTGRITLNKEKVNLSEIVGNLTRKYVEEIKLSGCSVHTYIKDDQIIGNWDSIRIEQAITNLFMNALRHAKNTKIVLTAKKDDHWAIFKIKDSGKGIPEQLQNEIFEPFKSATNSKTRGLGVGLFITKQIILGHGGQISVDSKPGKGSTFTIKLPL